MHQSTSINSGGGGGGGESEKRHQTKNQKEKKDKQKSNQTPKTKEMNNLFQERGTQTHGTSQHYFFFFAKQTVKVRPVPRQCHTDRTHPTKVAIESNKKVSKQSESC